MLGYDCIGGDNVRISVVIMLGYDCIGGDNVRIRLYRW